MRDYLEYLRIPYLHQGRTFQGADCFGLVRLFYDWEFNIDLPDFTEDYEQEWYGEHDYILERYAGYGFAPVDRPHRFGDLLFFKNTEFRVGHLGIVLPFGDFLHMTRSGCLRGSYTTGAPWRRLLQGVYRYQDGDHA